MSIIESVRDYIITCPLLESGTIVSVNSIGSEPIQYSINPIPSEIVLEEDILGNTLRQFQFIFSTREYNSTILQNLASQGFFEEFADWLDEQTEARIFPTLGTNQEALGIKAVTWGYLMSQDPSTSTGEYQVTCRLIYKQYI